MMYAHKDISNVSFKIFATGSHVVLALGSSQLPPTIFTTQVFAADKISIQ